MPSLSFNRNLLKVENLVFTCTIICMTTFVLNDLPAQTFTKMTNVVPVQDGGVSAGVSWVDYDSDGYLDLFVTNAQSSLNFLYHNNGNGSFTKVENTLITTDFGSSSGTSWADFDNDGDPDCFVANQQGDANFLYINRGEGEFEKYFTAVNGGNSYHCTWGDYDNDGFVDLFIPNFGQNNFLFHNNGAGQLIANTGSRIARDGSNSPGGSWGDFDNDGDLDLFVGCYYEDGNWDANNILYRNNGDGTFSKIYPGGIVTDGNATMASSWGDYDNDGDLDLFVGNHIDGTGHNYLYRNDGQGQFTNVTQGDMLTDTGATWSVTWVDVDNDGDLDLFVSDYDAVNILYENNGDGTFLKRQSGILVEDVTLSSGAGWGDYDNDGDLDLFVANWQNENNCLYRNEGNSNHWINILCVGTVSNRSAIGAKVRIKATVFGEDVWQMREISACEALRSQNSVNVEFGLGDASSIDTVVIEWPSGIVDTYVNINVDQFLTITETDQGSDVESDSQKPRRIQLFQNTPNPFNPTTMIHYFLHHGSKIDIKIYNLNGRLIRSLVSEYQKSGLKSIQWDGTDDTGQKVISGVYVTRLMTHGKCENIKMILMK